MSMIGSAISFEVSMKDNTKTDMYTFNESVLAFKVISSNYSTNSEVRLYFSSTN